MNIFEAMYKGRGKAVLPKNIKNEYCYFCNGCFLWETDTLVITKDCFRVSNYDLSRDDWKPYTEEIKETNTSQLKYDNMRESLEDSVENFIRLCDYDNAQRAINTLSLFLKLGEEWKV